VNLPYFICDHQNTVFFANLLGEREEIVVHWHSTTVTLDRFKHKCGNCLGPFRLYGFLELPR